MAGPLQQPNLRRGVGFVKFQETGADWWDGLMPHAKPSEVPWKLAAEARLATLREAGLRIDTLHASTSQRPGDDAGKDAGEALLAFTSIEATSTVVPPFPSLPLTFALSFFPGRSSTPFKASLAFALPS